MGASGNVGACVTRHLVQRGDDVRVLLRKSSSTRGIDGLDVEPEAAFVGPEVVLCAEDNASPALILGNLGNGQDNARGRSAHAGIVVYPDAYHDFDHPGLPLQQRSGVAFASGGSGRVHVGSDAAARADAQKRVTEWISR